MTASTEAALAAARQVDEAMVERAYRTWIRGGRASDRENARAALLAALTVPAPEETP